MQSNYLLPPRLTGPDGTPRAAGFEFEFGNLPILPAARALQSALGGQLEEISPFEALLHDSLLGRLRIERDADLLKSTRYRGWLQQLGVEFSPGSIGHEIESNIDSASRGLIPCEVITGPIPFEHLESLDALVEALEAIGAEGTQESLIYAFGLHINPSLPDLEPASVLSTLQSFLLLHAWLLEAGATDLTRRYLTPYIDAFPQRYMELVLRPDYQPDMRQLMDDYLAHNATRNRALDLLPLFAHIDLEHVRAALSREERKLVKGRPTFHYRLPDCRINQPGWEVATYWNHWVYIEALAADRDLLAELMRAWQAHYAEFMLVQNTRWVAQLTSILAQRYLSLDTRHNGRGA
ncbi:amidoligase enzyme [Mangrovimicrobium sediminis]|uniref:Amidoligase enzyme n=1 Tax=Mangrovimicrobium sediminis TaxID=2562682 RepID=A0A4Z0M4R3_9GAMM|nr:amidoligase family protein [Haliea sp. SAOS-164]TGD74683.1 amidoligase enzyme [Haliea sp. SAOS-164]